MAKYQIVQYYMIAKTYEVEANDEQSALDAVSNGSVKLYSVGGEEFCDETVEEVIEINENDFLM